MGRVFIGSVVAAIIMYAIGFVFYATPLFGLAMETPAPILQIQVQDSLRQLPENGTYFIPFPTDETLIAAHERGPRALLKLSKAGAPAMDPMILASGFVHFLLSAFLLGGLLFSLREKLMHFGPRMNLVFYVALIAPVFVRLSDPAWYGVGLKFALYTGFADFVLLMAAGAILSRWFIRRTAEI